MVDKIKLPPLLYSRSGKYSEAAVRTRDQETVRVVLEAAANAAELWYANGIETEIAREIRALKVET